VRCSAVYLWTPNVATRGDLTHLENTKSHFRPGGPRWGSSRRSPRPPSRLGRGIPPPHSSPPRPRRLRHLDSLRLRRLATRRLRRLGSAPVPLYLYRVPPNEFCWRRACFFCRPRNIVKCGVCDQKSKCLSACLSVCHRLLPAYWRKIVNLCLSVDADDCVRYVPSAANQHTSWRSLIDS